MSSAFVPACAWCSSRLLFGSRTLLPSRRMRFVPLPARASPRMQSPGGSRSDSGGGSSSSGGSSSGGGDEKPEGAIITKALELSFRNVWIRLMTSGVGPEYDDAIQAFVVSCVAAYKAGYSLTALKFELAANESAGEFMGVDTTLNDQEKETRMIWLALVYLTLARFNFASERTPPPVAVDLKGTKMEGLVSGLSGLVESVCDAAARGYNLQTFKMELNLKKDADAKPMTGAEASIRSQWSRIVFATIAILPDSLRGKPKFS